MKSFLKYTLATIVGVIIVNFILLLIGFAIIGTLSKLGEQVVDVKENSILRIQLNNAIPDRSSNNPFSDFSLFSFKPGISLGLNDILKNIEKASRDPRIQGIYLDLTDIQSNFGGLATTEEIREALKDFKKSGKEQTVCKDTDTGSADGHRGGCCGAAAVSCGGSRVRSGNGSR